MIELCYESDGRYFGGCCEFGVVRVFCDVSWGVMICW